MIKTCLVCGKQFEGGGNRYYCSNGCAYKAKIKNNAKYSREKKTEDRKKWAYAEAEKLAHLLVDQDAMDELTDYIYNNYQKYKGRK